MKNFSLSYSLLVIILVSLAISPAFALGEGNRNLMLIGVMGLSPLIILTDLRVYKKDLVLILFMLFLIMSPLLLNPETMRWSTVLYSGMFCLTFMAYSRLLKRNVFTKANYLRLLSLLIYAYFVVLLVQQFCVLTGIPIFNISNYDPYHPWKLNSLAAEPSHSARIVALLMYSYITIKELVTGRGYQLSTDFKSDRWIWLAFLWTMLTMGSATAFLFIAIVLLKFVRFRNLLPLLILFGIILLVVDVLGITVYERTYKTFLATLTLDEARIIEADHSAAMRIVPMIILAKMVSLSTLEGWFGHGVDFVSTFMNQILPGIPEGMGGGGLFQVWLEYGFIAFLFFIWFSIITTYNKHDYLSLLFWFFLVFMYGVNNQIVWLNIVLLHTNIFFKKQL